MLEMIKEDMDKKVEQSKTNTKYDDESVVIIKKKKKKGKKGKKGKKNFKKIEEENE